MQITPGWQKNLTAGLTAKLHDLGESLVDESREIVPVDTGKLRDSIGYVVENRSATGQFMSPTLVFGADEDYASHVEYGTVHQDAQPFIRPVVMKERGSF